MDCLKAVQAYVDKVVTNTSGIKVLLLDADTVRFACPSLLARTDRRDVIGIDSYRIARNDPISPPLA